MENPTGGSIPSRLVACNFLFVAPEICLIWLIRDFAALAARIQFIEVHTGSALVWIVVKNVFSLT